MGVRMSGAPSCANIEPSAYSTNECTTLCGCTTTSTCDSGKPNSSVASMTSSPLFISVAESTEILRPIFHFGCAQASSGVTLRAAAPASVQRNGPPEAVKITRVTPRAASPGR